MGIDIIIAYLPFTPFDAGPPLGLAILQAHLKAAKLSSQILDLNIHYLKKFSTDISPKSTLIIGDHAENSQIVQCAENHFLENLQLPDLSSDRIPCCCQPLWALPFSFTEINKILNQLEQHPFWIAFFEKYLFLKYEAPQWFGLSIMGPSQVLLSCFCAKLIRKKWPQTKIIAGGSHITLLTNLIAREKSYGEHIDYFLPQHSEHTLVNLIKKHSKKLSKDKLVHLPGVLHAGSTFTPISELPLTQRLPPIFNVDELALYNMENMSYPLQLRRGCGYGRCRYCTYPAVETFEKVAISQAAHQFLPEILTYQPKYISLKDSLLDLNAMITFGEVLHDLNSEIIWSATTKLVPGMNAKNMKRLYQLGCRTLEFGVETIHDNTQAVLDKPQPLDKIDAVILATVEAGITVIINLIFGIPTETYEQAEKQLEWLMAWKQRFPSLIFGSCNMLEINLGSPLANKPKLFDLQLKPSGPWAFSYIWNAPDWRPGFAPRLKEVSNVQHLTRKN